MDKYILLADLVIGLHLVIIALVVTGCVASFWKKELRPVMLVAFIFLFAVWRAASGCPLTFLENSLLERAGHPSNLAQLGFIRFYVRNWFGLSLSAAWASSLSYGLAGLMLLLTLDWAVRKQKTR